MGSPVKLDLSKARPITLDMRRTAPIDQPVKLDLTKARALSPAETPAQEEVPGLFSGEYRGETGTIAPGESLPHALGRQLLGGVGSAAKGLATFGVPTTLEEAVGGTLPGGPLGVAIIQGLKGQAEAGKRALELAKEKRYSEAAGYGLGAALPLVGPMVAGATERAAEGTVDPAAELGTLAATAKAAPSILRAGAKGFRTLREANIAARAPAIAAEQRNNFSAALEMGGKPGTGEPLTFEDVSPVVVPEFRAEAARRGITPNRITGRQGYELAARTLEGVERNFNNAYKELVDPVRERPASDLAKQSASDLADTLGGDAVLQETLQLTGKVNAVNQIIRNLKEAKTVGDLDAQRIAFNKVGFKGSTDVSKAMRKASHSIRDSLYPELERLYEGQVSADQIRAFQKRHGMAIQANDLMQETRRAASSVASKEAAPHTLTSRLLGGAYTETAQPVRAAGAVVQRFWGPRQIELFNTQIQRVLKNPEPAVPFVGIAPLGGPIGAAPPAAVPETQIPEAIQKAIAPQQEAKPEALISRLQQEKDERATLISLRRKIKSGLEKGEELSEQEANWLSSKGIDIDEVGALGKELGVIKAMSAIKQALRDLSRGKKAGSQAKKPKGEK